MLEKQMGLLISVCLICVQKPTTENEKTYSLKKNYSLVLSVFIFSQVFLSHITFEQGRNTEPSNSAPMQQVSSQTVGNIK